jgi:hypothetical protein
LTSQWQRRRNRFNHDWLKNRLMPSLVRYLNILRGLVQDDEFLEAFPIFLDEEWTSHRCEAFSLLEQFEVSESPRNLFLRPPLARCDDLTREWLANLSHEIWISRNAVRPIVADATDRANEADTAYARLRAALNSAPRDGHAKLVLEFHGCCQDLADSLSSFPRQIQIV